MELKGHHAAVLSLSFSGDSLRLEAFCYCLLKIVVCQISCIVIMVLVGGLYGLFQAYTPYG